MITCLPLFRVLHPAGTARDRSCRSSAYRLFVFKARNNHFHGFLVFFIGRIVEQHQVQAVTHFLQCLRDGVVDCLYIFIPVLQFPGITYGVAVDHALVTDLRFGDNPDDNKLCTVVCKFFGKVFQELLIVYFARERCIDEHDIVVLECFQSEIDRYFIFIIADIFLKKIRTAVDFFTACLKNAPACTPPCSSSTGCET